MRAVAEKWASDVATELNLWTHVKDYIFLYLQMSLPTLLLVFKNSGEISEDSLVKNGKTT